jgi:adenosine deaminase
MRRTLLPALLLCLTPSIALAQQPRTGEQHAIRAFDQARSNPLALHAFLFRMPKGADLHMHLSGAVYAETFLQNAIADNACIDPKSLALIKNVGTTKSIPAKAVCPEGQVAAASVLKNQKLYDDMVDSFSMRGFVPTPGITGHDQFFATFARFGGLKDHAGEWLDEVATRAAAQNEQYLEVMHTANFSAASTLGYKLGWPTGAVDPILNPRGDPTGTTPVELGHLRDQLLADPTFRQNVEQDRKEYADALATRNRIEHCGQPNAVAACAVQVRFLGQVLRAFAPEQVFAQTLLYFELASTDPDVVGINFVQPEDAYMAMSEYHRQMLMLDYLHTVYPKVHISLHAGELAPGMVPPAGLLFHIREAIDLGHAERIGHGVDIMYELDPQALLKEMADRHIMTEINLTSNDVILGVSLNHHSLPAYRAAHVPVALSTDDEGVSRINLTHEYARAAIDFGLGYLDLKTMARTSLEHSFLAGLSLWQQQDSFTRTVPDCAAQPLGAETPNAKCTAFLRSSDKAAQQWELEHRYKVFESTLP